ncbi:hypothetical protein TSOC_005282, partial [Tetrabaena socialis]
MRSSADSASAEAATNVPPSALVDLNCGLVELLPGASWAAAVEGLHRNGSWAGELVPRGNSNPLPAHLWKLTDSSGEHDPHVLVLLGRGPSPDDPYK